MKYLFSYLFLTIDVVYLFIISTLLPTILIKYQVSSEVLCYIRNDIIIKATKFNSLKL